jgi:hypothetical protein
MKRSALSLAAAALAGTVLPWSTATPAQAEEEPAFTGFSTTAWAAPVRLEIYEPTIPLPASPQAEANFAYTTVEADSSSSHGRASWLWPGDPAGEGLKTIMEQAGAADIAMNYPIQVNSNAPSEQESQADEPFPGTVMRTSAGEARTMAQAGYSPDNEAQDPQDGDGGSGGGGGGVPGLPEVPGVPGTPPLPGAGLTDPLQAYGDAITGQQSTSGSSAGNGAADDPQGDAGAGAPGVPPEIAAIVDFTGYTSTSVTSTGDDRIVTGARSAVSDVELLGGVITISDVHGRSSSASDGAKGKPAGNAGYGTLAIAGNEFTIGPDGVEASGQQGKIPGLPDDAAKALEQLGVKLVVPKPSFTRDGDEATSSVEALRIEIDTAQLRSQLDSVPFDDMVGAVPDETGKLKSLLGAAVHLSPKLVVLLGNATTAVDTVQGIDIPSTPPTTDTGDTGDTGTTGSGGDSGGSSSTAPPSAPGVSAPGGSSAPAADGDLTDAAPMGAGLPPLFSIPGALLFGGIALATAGGSYFRKIGALALGGVGSCPHGLDSGLPDLRKA